MVNEKRERQKKNREQKTAGLENAARRAQMKRYGIIGGVCAGVLLIVLFLISVMGDSPETATAPEDTQRQNISTPCFGEAESAETTRTFDSPPENSLQDNVNYSAIIATSRGDIEVDLYSKKAPVTTNNFVCLARSGYYDGLIFHRVIDGFMIQGGDPTGTGSGGPGYSFEDELPEPGEYKLGSIAMANSGPNTNGSQFFVITGDAGVNLPPQYSLFGETTSGLDVATQISQTDTQNDRPVNEVTIESVTIVEDKGSADTSAGAAETATDSATTPSAEETG